MGQRRSKILDVEDVVSIREFFDDLPDSRSSINQKHRLGDIIVICVCAVLAGADGPLAISVWAEAKREWLQRYLQPENGIPSRSTIARVLASLKPSTFQECFQAWLAVVAKPSGEGSRAKLDQQIAIDGKALRRSHDRRRSLGPLHVVSAWSVEGGISLGQLSTADKSGEIAAMTELIERLEVKGATLTIDAAGCQTAIADQIVAAGGNYVLALTGNQANTLKETEAWIECQMESDSPDVVKQTHEVTEKNHGRQTTNWYTQFEVPESMTTRHRWAGLKTIGVAVRQCERDGKTSYETRYFLSSLPLDVKRMASAIRNHWKIENSLHWCLDMTFREDESRLRDRIAADNLAWLKKFALSLLKQVQSKLSIVGRRRMAGWNEDYLAQVLGLKAT
jgi:predicted transposase YbfD/YdcC